jgi:hypothetical protein
MLTILKKETKKMFILNICPQASSSWISNSKKTSLGKTINPFLQLEEHCLLLFGI